MIPGRAEKEPIAGDGLDLVLVPEATLRAVADGRGRAAGWLGMDAPSDGLVRSMPARRRVGQIDDDPSVAPWLLRIIVVPGDEGRSVIAGSLGGHGRPDERGMVEVGYTLDPAFRGRGLATAAALAWFGWAARCGARVARISAALDNAPSLAVGARLGLVPVGRSWDEEDQVWERVLEAPLPLTDRPIGGRLSNAYQTRLLMPE